MDPPAKRARIDPHEIVKFENASAEPPGDGRVFLNSEKIGISASAWATELAGRAYYPQRSEGWFNERWNRFVSSSSLSPIIGAKTINCHAITRRDPSYVSPFDKLGLAEQIELSKLPRGDGYNGMNWAAAWRLYQKFQHTLRVPRDPAEVGPLRTCHMFRGTIIEPLITAIVERVLGVETLETGLVPHPTMEHVGASPDGVVATPVQRRLVEPNGPDEVMQRVLLEFKAPIEMKANYRDGRNERLTDLYNGYFAQMQAQIRCTGATHVIYVRLVWDAVVAMFGEPPDGEPPDGQNARKWVADVIEYVPLTAMGPLRSLIDMQVCECNSAWFEEQVPLIDEYVDEVLADRAKFKVTAQMAQRNEVIVVDVPAS